MSKNKASIREKRTDLASSKHEAQMPEEIPGIGNRVRLESPPRKAPDYYARLLEEQPHSLSSKQSRELHEHNRGNH